MENIKVPVYLTTAILLLYCIVSLLYPDPTIIVGVFTLSPFLVIWMVYRVLKDGVESTKTFEEYFYEDADIKRLPIKEASECPEYFSE